MSTSLDRMDWIVDTGDGWHIGSVIGDGRHDRRVQIVLGRVQDRQIVARAMVCCRLRMPADDVWYWDGLGVPNRVLDGVPVIPCDIHSIGPSNLAADVCGLLDERDNERGNQ